MREWYKLLAAVMFYTRIPIPEKLHTRMPPLDQATRYFPVIGWLVGGAGAFVFWLGMLVFPLWVAIILSLMTTVGITGAFHEDGLADVLDGFGGGWTREQVLAIMKDSRLGTYGAVGLTLGLLLKVNILSGFAGEKIPWILVLGHSLSRWGAATFIFTHHYAESQNVSKAKPVAGRLGIKDLILMSILAWRPFLFFQNILLMLAIIPVYLAKMIFAGYCSRRIGGYTGDCLGATQQICEWVVYLTLFIIWEYI